MKLKFYLNRMDWFLGSIRVSLFNRALLTLLVLCATFVLLSSAAAALNEGRGIVFVAIYSVLTFVIWAIVLVGALLAVNALKILMTKGEGLIGEHELEISEQGLTERTEYNDSLHRWNGVNGIYETPLFYLIRVNEAGGSVHIIPKKNRVIEGDLEAFIQEVRSRIANSGLG